jgi:predicted dehydrogenase
MAAGKARLRAVMAGLGGFAPRWLEVCKGSGDVELVGFAARSERSRERAATELGLPRDRLFASVAEALERTHPDFVLDVTPPAAHREVALAAFAAGAAVLGEKPLSDDPAAAREIVAAGARAGCLHMVSQQQRFARQPRLTRKLLEAGEIGDPGQLDIAFFVPWADKPGTHYVTQPYMFLLDMGCHHFDTMRYVLAGDPVAATVVSWNLPWGWHKGDASHVGVFEFPRGVRGVHRAMGCSIGHRTVASGEWRLEGPRGSITWEEGKVFVSEEHRVTSSRRREVPVDANALEGQQAVLAEFVAAMRAGREPECSGRDNLGTVAMTFGALASAREGRRVEIRPL